MTQFSYKAKTTEGEVKNGKIIANDQKEVEELMKRRGLFLISAKDLSGKKKYEIKLPKFMQRVGLVDKMLFTRNLAVMLQAGLSFARALSILAEQTKSAYFREILQDISKDVQKGSSLGDSLAKYPKVFNNLFVSMVRVGETGGNLEEVLSLLALQLKKDHEITSKVKGAMMYPAVILTAMSLIGVLMMVFVFPSLLKMFSESGTELPVTTRALIFISESLQNYGLFILIGFIALLVMFIQTIKTPAGKKSFDGILLKIPVVNGIIMKVNVARFSRTLSSMITSGVSIVQALDVISGTLGNSYYKDSAADACKKVQKGLDLSEVMAEYGNIYPGMMIHMIEVGEETGSLENTLKQVAEFYEEEVDQFTSNLSSVIEPILMLVMGGAVGFFAISLIQPMYSIMETI
jgi:type IV pilus assembly protein PilC